ncbi:MAG: BMP family ABC transporter substrate-binding protein, partial [Acidimicrobiia bacterium]|nr:BMP family ABC transporter substrate-binding protein [Acidimicrobiia bacterium]
AAATISDLAIEGYDLVIAHSSTFRSIVSTIAREHPDVTFAVGPVDDQPVRSNVYTYGVAAEQGGFVLGALAARLSATGVIGAVGPVEAGVSERYIEAFRAGAQSELPEIAVLVSYTGSFSDAEAAAASTAELLTAGADVITGQGHDMSQAMAAVRAAGARWLGNQVNQASVEPTAVVASQVYHWEVVLRSIIEDVDNGVGEGRNHRADLANGGVVIELNPDLRPSAADLDRIDELVADAGLDAPASN